MTIPTRSFRATKRLLHVLALMSALWLPFLANSEEIKLRVGVISGLTGAAAQWCAFQNKGMILAQEELKSEGISMELVFEDSQTSGPKAITAYNKLIQLDKVDAVIADDFGLVIAPLLPLVERRTLPLVATSLPQQRYCDVAPKQFFSVSSQIAYSRTAYDRFFELHPDIKRISVVAFDDPEWGNAYLAIWRDIASQRGITIVDTFLNNEWQPDFKTPLTRMISNNPDAILFAHEPEGMMKALHQLHFQGPILAANNILEMVAKTELPRPDVEGVYFVDSPVSEDFRRKFADRFKREPILEAYAGYESVRSLAEAAKDNRVDLAAGMRKVHYKGVAGEINFTQATCAGNRANWELFRFVGGKRVRQ